MSDERDPKIADLLMRGLDGYQPRSDFRQRVMDRVAAARTALELARLVGIAPIHDAVGTTGRESMDTNELSAPTDPDPDEGEDG